MELEAARVGALHSGSVIMHVNKVHSVTTIGHVAKHLGEDEGWLSDVAYGMDPKTASSGSSVSVTMASWRSPTSASKT